MAKQRKPPTTGKAPSEGGSSVLQLAVGGLAIAVAVALGIVAADAWLERQADPAPTPPPAPPKPPKPPKPPPPDKRVDCAIMAIDGDCSREPTRDRMLSNCATACATLEKSQSLHRLDAPEEMQAIGAVRTQMVGDREVELTTLSLRPALFAVRGLFSEDEAKHIVDGATRKGWRSSSTGDGGATRRTSSESRLTAREDHVVRAIDERLSSLLQLPEQLVREGEGLQVIQYKPGQGYASHTDYDVPDWYRGEMHRFRLLTVQLYLHASEDGGGGGDECAGGGWGVVDDSCAALAGGDTWFPLASLQNVTDAPLPLHPRTLPEYEWTNAACEEGLPPAEPGHVASHAREEVARLGLGLRVAPRRVGDALVFYHMAPGPDGHGYMPDPFSLHAGCDVTAGVKIIANKWIWTRPKPPGHRY